MIRLTFMGANRQVTGSRYCLEANGSHVMIDCGLVQEREFLGRNWESCPIPPGKIDALLLTHVHIDHSGLIPKLVREGFTGKIYATRPTVDLADIVLHDAAHIQKEDSAYKKKRHRREGRRGKFPEKPLYTVTDVEKAMHAFRGIDYDTPIEVADGITVIFRNAGHILGSASLELLVQDEGKEYRIVFSGDLGQAGKPLIGDPSYFAQADFVVMESTYGNRDHDKSGDKETQLADVINQTVRRGGNLVIPTFAIERAQELMYYIGRLVYADRIPDIPIFLDSPMAVDVTEIFRQHRSYLDENTQQLIMSNEPPLRFPGLHFVQAVAASKAINHVESPCVIMSPAGMCNAGRIKHHLRNNIGNPKNTVLFVGYQAYGTLGRLILEGSSEVRIHGGMYRVKAKIAHINGFSGHADRGDLLNWLKHLRTPPQHVFLTHGEESAAEHLAGQIKSELGWSVSVPHYLDEVTLPLVSTEGSSRDG